MTLSDCELLSKMSNYTERRAAYLQQLSFFTYRKISI